MYYSRLFGQETCIAAWRATCHLVECFFDANCRASPFCCTLHAARSEVGWIFWRVQAAKRPMYGNIPRNTLKVTIATKQTWSSPWGDVWAILKTMLQWHLANINNQICCHDVIVTWLTTPCSSSSTTGFFIRAGDNAVLGSSCRPDCIFMHPCASQFGRLHFK